MNSIKPLAIVAVLGAVGIGLYLKINKLPEPQPPRDFSGAWGSPPLVELDGTPQGAPAVSMGDPAAGAAGGTAPPYQPPQVSVPAAGGTAPPYQPPASTPEAGGLAPPPGAGASAPQDTAAASPHAHHDVQPAPDAAPVFNPFAGGLPQQEAAAGTTAYPRTDTPGPSDSNGAADDSQYGPQPSTSAADAAQPPPAPSNIFQAPRHSSFELAWQDARAMLDRGELADALLLLSSWYEHPTLSPVEQNELSALLSQLAGTVIYSRDYHMEAPYVVRSGETLADIAAQYNVPATLLAHVNGLVGPDQLEAGQQLKVVRGPFSAQVDVQRRRMVLGVGGCYAGRFPIGLGREREEIEGEYIVSNKRTNPVYYGPDRTIEGGSPDNPLGSYWVGLTRPAENTVSLPFGIHGDRDAASPARDDARGYIRLSSTDAADAYDILSVGSHVLVR